MSNHMWQLLLSLELHWLSNNRYGCVMCSCARESCLDWTNKDLELIFHRVVQFCFLIIWSEVLKRELQNHIPFLYCFISCSKVLHLAQGGFQELNEFNKTQDIWALLLRRSSRKSISQKPPCIDIYFLGTYLHSWNPHCPNMNVC